MEKKNTTLSQKSNHLDLGLDPDTNYEILGNYEISQSLSDIIYRIRLKWSTIPFSSPSYLFPSLLE